MAAHDNVVLVNTSGGARTITLPAPTNGRVLKIKDSTGNANTNNITINPNASELIDGTSSKVINFAFGSASLVSDGTNWFLDHDDATTVGGVSSIGTIDSQTASANGLVITGSSLVAQSASVTVPGLVNNTTQSFSGAKTFTGAISASNLSGTNTGDQTITLTSDVTGSGTGSFATTIAANAVTNAKAAQMAANTIKGNNTGSTANALDLTTSQVKTLLDLTGTNSGDVTLAAIGSTPNANAATLSGQVLNLEPASASFGGVVTTGTQTLAGAKTLTGDTLIAQATAAIATIGLSGSTATHQINGGLQITTNTVSSNYSIS